MAWLRWHEGTVNDPKFMVVSRKSGQPVGFVLAVWAMLLERASSADERGSIGGFDCESADAVMGMPDGAACAIVQAMQDKGLISEDFVCRWAERQPLRERSDEAPSTERVRKHRERQKENGNTNLENETPCNAMKHHETPRGEEIRGEEKKENTKNPPYPPTGGDECGEHDPRLAAKTEGQRRERKPQVYSSGFEHFWQNYPRKSGKDAAWKVYQRRNGEIPKGEEMAAILARHSQAEQWQRDAGQYIPLPATWLNQGRWKDEITNGPKMALDPPGW